MVKYSIFLCAFEIVIYINQIGLAIIKVVASSGKPFWLARLSFYRVYNREDVPNCLILIFIPPFVVILPLKTCSNMLAATLIKTISDKDTVLN